MPCPLALPSQVSGPAGRRQISNSITQARLVGKRPPGGLWDAGGPQTVLGEHIPQEMACT